MPVTTWPFAQRHGRLCGAGRDRPAAARSGYSIRCSSGAPAAASPGRRDRRSARMAACARSVEIPFPRRGVAGLQIGDVHASAAADRRVRLRLLIVNEGDDRRQIGVGQVEGRHPLSAGRCARPGDAITAHVSGDERGTREIGTAFATCGVAAMAEAALRGKPRAAGLDLLGRIGSAARPAAAAARDAGLACPRPCGAAGAAPAPVHAEDTPALTSSAHTTSIRNHMRDEYYCAFGSGE